MTSTPPLVDGQRLTASEFHRRYMQMPDVKKAELIAGVVYMPSPVRFTHHGQPQHLICGWLFHYHAHMPDTRTATDCTVIMDDHNEVQPDGLMFRVNTPEPRCRLNADGYLEGAPELVVEVAASTLDRDIGPKREVYERAGVQEYLLWNVTEQQITWWELQDQHYHALPMSENIIKSRVFPGLWLHVGALLTGNAAEVLTTLQTGLQQRIGTSSHG